MTVDRAGALRVQMFITGWHTRTAPRVDDEDAVKFVADVWAKALNDRRVSLADALAGVEERAMADPSASAPELAEVIAAGLRVRSRRVNEAIDRRAIGAGSDGAEVYPAAALAVVCPECAAPAGELCRIDVDSGRVIFARRPCKSRTES